MLVLVWQWIHGILKVNGMGCSMQEVGFLLRYVGASEEGVGIIQKLEVCLGFVGSDIQGLR